jgi:thiol-disulfide isomerase/thioredoxin
MNRSMWISLSCILVLFGCQKRDGMATSAKRGDAAQALTGLEWVKGGPVELKAGTVYVVEFWATWCPPCRGTLGWLSELRRAHGDRLVVLALAIDSDEKDVRRVAAEAGAPLRWAMGTPGVARAFGDVSAVPTLLLFDGQGRRVGSFFGAPPSLHGEVEAKLEALLR